MNFTIQKLKSNFPQKIHKLTKTNTFFSRFEGTRGEKTKIFYTIVPSSKRVPKVLKWFDNPYFIQKQPNLEALDNGNDDNDINNIIDEAKINLGKLTQGYLTQIFPLFKSDTKFTVCF